MTGGTGIATPPSGGRNITPRTVTRFGLRRQPIAAHLAGALRVVRQIFGIRCASLREIAAALMGARCDWSWRAAFAPTVAPRPNTSTMSCHSPRAACTVFLIWFQAVLSATLSKATESLGTL